MPVFEEVLDLLSAAIVIIIISALIALAWMSTYVRNQPIVATAVVVFQQDTLSNMGSNAEDTPAHSESSASESSELNSNIPSCSHDGVNPESSILDSKKSSIATDFKSLDSVGNDFKSKNEKVSDSVNDDTSEESENILSVSQDLEESSSEESELSSTSSDLKCKEKNVGTSCETVDSYKPLREESNREEPPDRIEAEAEIQYEELPSEFIRIKLKFLDDTHRLVRGQLTDEVGSFKRVNFTSELSSNRVVRLIFNGQLLNRDSSTLGQYGLFDNCVVHCHISQPQPTNSNDRNDSLNQDAEGLDISEILSPLLIIIVAFLWYLRYEYSHIFNTSATIILVCLTALLLVSQYALSVSFNISFGYDNGNSGNNSNPRLSSGLETNRVEAIQPNSSVDTSAQPTRGEVQEEETSRGGESVNQEDFNVDNSSQPGSSFTSSIRSLQERNPSFPINNCIPTSNPILLNS